MTIIAIALYAAGLATGGGLTWLKLRPKLDQLAKLTDRDPKTGRFI